MSVFKNYFYHDLTRKYNLIFGSIFKDIEVQRFTDTGKVQSMITVPVIHSPKEKFIQRIKGDVDNSDVDEGGRRRIAMQMPMIAFEMVDMQYDGTRKIAKNNHMRVKSKTHPGTSDKIYTPCPYTLTFEVNIISKTQSEILQIIEQIIPAFTPDINITLKGVEGAEYDVPITFIGLFRNDTYIDILEERRHLMWTLNFTMKAFYFTPIIKKSIILDVNVPTYHLHNEDDLSEATLIQKFHADENDLIGKWENT